jgi:hypothetical protein
MRDSLPFKDGKAKFDYVKNMTHDGWRMTFPYYIDLYKTGTTAVSGDVVITLKRGNNVLATLHGASLGGCSPNGYASFNPWAVQAPSL